MEASRGKEGCRKGFIASSCFSSLRHESDDM